MARDAAYWQDLHSLAVRERKQLSERVANCLRYDRELDTQAISPTGDDYNAILEMLTGKPYRNPTPGGR